ncbi:Sugar transporter, partial [Operophtera brumata]
MRNNSSNHDYIIVSKTVVRGGISATSGAVSRRGRHFPQHTTPAAQCGRQLYSPRCDFQLFVAGSPQLAALSVGAAVTFPSILLQQLSSIHGLAGIPSILMPSIMQWQGRKFAFILACLVSTIGWVLALSAAVSVAILISESFHGLGNNSLLAVSLLSMSEMVAPRYRNVSMVSYSILQGFGMTLCGILGRYLHWKTVSAIMCAPVFVAMLIGFMWPESPSWLAYRGEFEKCEQAFFRLRGVDELSKKELDELISAQKETLAIKRQNKYRFTHKLRTLFNRDFYLPSFHMFVLILLAYSSGSMVIFVYTVKVIQSATLNEDAAYFGSIFVNSIVFICLGISAALVRRFSNKSILMFSTISTVLCLSGSSLSTYLQIIYILPQDSLVGLFFLLGYVMSISSGIIPIVFTIAAELMPVKHRDFGGGLDVLYTCLLHSVSLKAAPYLFIHISFWGTLLLYAASSTVCGLYIWKFIPETKGRTLQELENYYTYGYIDTRRSIYGVSGIPVVFLPFIMQWKGRKISYIITCMFLFIGWILSITATNVDLILASESFHGLGSNSLLPVAFLSMTEMLAPKYRYIAMQIFGISGALGMCSTGILGRYLHYKTISIIMFVPAAVAMGIAFFWVESPPWLACKGEFKKCEEAFLWLRGRDDPSMKELKELITAQKENLSRSRSKPRMSWNSFWEQVTSRDFYTPSLHIFVLLNMMYWSGGDVVLIYFIEIVQKTTQNQDATFYASIAMYCIYFLGAVTTNITVRKFKNKTVLLASASGVIMCLLSASIVTFLQSLGTLAKDSILCMFCLLGFMMCNCLGLNAVVFYIAAELMPVRHRSIGGALFIIFNCGLYASTQKTSPYMFLYIDMWGTFMIYTLVVATSPQLAAFSLGGCLPYPTIILQQLKANDSSIHLDLETSSWIGSIYGFAGIPVIMMPMLMQWKGRRFAYIVTCLFVIIGWILSLSATNIGMILASESFHGLGTNSLLPVSFLSLTEMLAPKYRYISMQLFG